MARPGVVVTSRAEAPPRSAPTQAGMAFMIGATEKGAPVKRVSSLTAYENEFGVRTGFTDAYDSAETFYREGGTLLTVARTNVTPEALAAMTAGGAIPYPDGGTIAEVLAWVDEDPGRATAALENEEAGGNPRATLVAQLEAIAEGPPPRMAGGAVDAGVAAALDALTRDLGPGQVFVPGVLGEAADTHNALIAHAADNNRIALLDAPGDADAAALEALAGTYTAGVNARYAALFAPPAIVPGITGVDTRTVPYSAIEAGIMSRNAALYSPNVPAAGVNGISRFAIDLPVAFTDAEREDLNAAGVDVAKLIYGDVRTYGYRTLAPLTTGWGLLSNARLNMEIVAKAEAIGERYLFTQIDGRRVRISQFGADLTGMLVPYYEAGSLFGVSVDDAFIVDVGPAVNTLESIAAGELHAVLSLRMSPFAEYVVIEIVKVATETPLAVAA